MTKRRTLATSDERRSAVLAAAVSEFARNGLPAGSTQRIAAEAQIAHSYLFKLFGSKKALFLAATQHVYEHIGLRFRAAAEAHSEDPLTAMGGAYRDLLHERDELLLLLHGFAAADDPDLGPVVRDHYTGLYRLVRDLSGADAQRMQTFWAHGMLMTIAAALSLPTQTDDQAWVTALLTLPPDLDPATSD